MNERNNQFNVSKIKLEFLYRLLVIVWNSDFTAHLSLLGGSYWKQIETGKYKYNKTMLPLPHQHQQNAWLI